MISTINTPINGSSKPQKSILPQSATVRPHFAGKLNKAVWQHADKVFEQKVTEDEFLGVLDRSLKEGGDINDFHGHETLLQTAARESRSSLVKALLDRGANPNIRTLPVTKTSKRILPDELYNQQTRPNLAQTVNASMAVLEQLVILDAINDARLKRAQKQVNPKKAKQLLTDLLSGLAARSQYRTKWGADTEPSPTQREQLISAIRKNLGGDISLQSSFTDGYPGGKNPPLLHHMLYYGWTDTLQQVLEMGANPLTKSNEQESLSQAVQKSIAQTHHHIELQPKHKETLLGRLNTYKGQASTLKDMTALYFRRLKAAWPIKADLENLYRVSILHKKYAKQYGSLWKTTTPLLKNKRLQLLKETAEADQKTQDERALAQLREARLKNPPKKVIVPENSPVVLTEEQQTAIEAKKRDSQLKKARKRQERIAENAANKAEEKAKKLQKSLDTKQKKAQKQLIGFRPEISTTPKQNDPMKGIKNWAARNKKRRANKMTQANTKQPKSILKGEDFVPPLRKGKVGFAQQLTEIIPPQKLSTTVMELDDFTRFEKMPFISTEINSIQRNRFRDANPEFMKNLEQSSWQFHKFKLSRHRRGEAKAFKRQKPSQKVKVTPSTFTPVIMNRNYNYRVRSNSVSNLTLNAFSDSQPLHAPIQDNYIAITDENGAELRTLKRRHSFDYSIKKKS